MSLILALLAVIFAGRLILQKYNPQAVLLLTGLALLLIAQVAGYADITSLPVKSTGTFFFDMFEHIRDILSSRIGGLGLQIMLVGGFAMYMSYIGASQVLVRLSSKPLQRLNSPYLLLGIAYLLGQFLSLFISSATGLGLLLMATLYPLLTRLGCSRAAVASVIASTCAVEFGPAMGNSILAAKTANLDVVDYFLHAQLPIAIPLVLAIAVMHVLVQRYFDSRSVKDDVVHELDSEKLKETETNAPLFYLLLPMLPLIFMLAFSKIGFESIRLTLDTAILISLFICMICEYVRLRSAKDVMASLQKVFNNMGGVFATVVTLIVAGETFSAGLKSIGAVDALLSLTDNLGLSAAPIILMMTLLTFLISALMGSGNAAFFSFAPMVPDISASIGSNVATMVLPIQMSAGLGRTISPIAGIIIAVAGIAGLSPIDIVKRTAIPMLAGWFLMLVLTFSYSGQLLATAPYLIALVLITLLIGYAIKRKAMKAA